MFYSKPNVTVSNASVFAHLLPALVLLLSSCATLPPAILADVIIEDAHHGNGTVVAFAGAGDMLASAGSEGDVHLWRLPDGASLGTWQAHDNSVHGLQFLQRDSLLLTAGYDGSFALWSRDGRLLRRLETPSPVTAMETDETAGLVVSGHADGAVRVWRLTDFSLKTEFVRHARDVRAVTFHRASGHIASSGADGQVFIGRLGETPRALAEPPSDARDLSFAPDGRHLLGSGWFRLFRWDLADGALRVLPTVHDGIITSVNLSADGRLLATISRQTDSAVHLLDPETGALRQRLQPHELCGAAVRLSANGRFLATTADDGSVRIWELKNSAK